MYKIIVISAVLAFALSVSLIPAIIHACKKFCWYDSTNERKIHKGLIPRLGSVAFVPAAFIAAACFCIGYPESRPLEYAPLAIGAFLIFVFGVVDDFKDLSARKKLLVQIIASLLMVFSGKTFTTIGSFVLPSPLSGFLTFMWICGMINAFNLIDGVDGLCGGLSALVFASLGIIYLHTNATMATFCFIIVAALGGFLVYNKPKACIFMGDGGSQFLGFMIAALPLYRSGSGFEVNKVFSMVLLTCIPVIDTIAAMIRRRRAHRSFFSPDRAHLHHKLMNIGLSGVQILILLLSVQAILCTVVCVSLLFDAFKAVMIMGATWFIVLGAFCLLHYANRNALKNKEKSEAEGRSVEPLVLSASLTPPPVRYN